YQTGALSPAHLADITARQREVSQIVRQIIADGVSSRDFDIPDPGAAATAVLSLCLDVARWYRPGHRLTPQQLGDFNAVAARRIVGGRPAAGPGWAGRGWRTGIVLARVRLPRVRRSRCRSRRQRPWAAPPGCCTWHRPPGFPGWRCTGRTRSRCTGPTAWASWPATRA